MASIKNIFDNLELLSWFEENSLGELFPCNSKGQYIYTKLPKGIYENVQPCDSVEYPPEIDDLVRLHYLVRSRKVLNILEFGVGKSTIIFADALKRNKKDFGKFVSENIRREEPFKVYCLDNSKVWIANCKKQIPSDLKEFVSIDYTEVHMSTFNDRVCTLYEKLPNICPDLIYLDAPSQFGVIGDVHGLTTESVNRVPMSADILLMEPLLLPGTLIVVDGRTANARFLKNNFQRDWDYHHFIEEDIHLFELVETPLGDLNRIQMEFCLGHS